MSTYNPKKLLQTKLTDRIRKFFKIEPYLDIMSWIDTYISLVDDVSSEKNKPDFTQYPYQVDILKQWEKIGENRMHVVVCAAEQLGKTTTFLYGLLYSMVYYPCQSLIVYPSDGKAGETNQTKIQPLISHIPGLKDEIHKKGAMRADRYNFSNLVSYFQGSGAKIVSKSCKVVVGDEVDQWDQSHPQNLKDLFKRTRSYSSCMEFIVCSPTEQNGSIWQEFLKGSQGYYTLRCKGCGNLTMRSCDVHNLQFESTYNEDLRCWQVKPGTERLVCPICKHAHAESEKPWMIQHGGYVHKIPSLTETRPSFQIGTLASMLNALSWSEIANAQLESGKSSDITIQRNFDNSWRGLPYSPRKISQEDVDRLRERHCWRLPINPDTIEMIYATSDTMDDYSSYAVFAWDIHDSLWLLEAGEVPYIELTEEKRTEVNEARKNNGLPPVVTLDDILQKNYFNIPISFMVVDAGGHRAGEVKHFAKMHRTVVMWKGTSMTAATYKASEIAQLFIGNEKYFKSMAIFSLYAQRNQNENYIWLTPELDDAQIAQITDVQPDNGVKWGDRYENWISKTR